jgi:hypothetical protein
MFLLYFIPNDSQSSPLIFPKHDTPPDNIYFEIIYVLYSKKGRAATIVRKNKADATVPFAAK